MKTLGRLGFAAIILFLLAATAAWAQAPAPGPDPNQDQGPNQIDPNQSYPNQTNPGQTNPNQADSNQPDPPGRVARLQYMSGSVSVQPQGTGDWVEGVVNRPLTDGDNIWADKDSRAELNVGSGILRLNSESSLTLTNVNENTVQVQLHQGTLSLEVRRLYNGEVYEVDTQNLAFTVQKPGEYRFDVDPNADTTNVVVWKGAGEATGQGPAVELAEHQSAHFSNGTSLTNVIAQAPAYDGFDDWGHLRDEQEQGTVAARHVSQDMVGYEDLDEYGSWRNEPDYGDVWYPSGVAAGWAPYRFGHWVWIAPWGWTWVDDAPWGFAPFHYGRWVYAGGFWGWAPGPIWVRPYYAPALVAWFGGPGWGIGLGFGGGFGYGWCPLGWNEPFIPWYHSSFGYYRNVNITNIHVRDFGRFNGYYGGRETFRGYSNLRYPGGATAVSRETIVGARPVNRSMVRVSANEFARAPLGGRVGLTPTRESRLGINAGRPAAAPPQRAFSRPVVSRMAAPSRGNLGGQRGAEAGGIHNNHETAVRGMGNMNRNVPRPPQSNRGSFNQRTTANSNVRTNPNAERGSFSSRGSANVPRPPAGNRGSINQRTEANSNVRANTNAERGSYSNRAGASASVPRPPANGARGAGNERSSSMSQRPESGGGARPSGNMPAERSVPRPQGNSNRGGGEHSGGESHGSSHPQGHSMNYVPRPTGPVRPAGNYSASTRGNYGGGQAYRGYSSNNREMYGSSSRSYGSPYSSRPSPYAGSYGNSRSSYPQYNARSYGAPSYRSAPSYGSSRSYSSPRSYGSSRSYSAPSSHGGGSYHASSGGYHGGGGSSHGGGGGHGRGR